MWVLWKGRGLPALLRRSGSTALSSPPLACGTRWLLRGVRTQLRTVLSLRCAHRLGSLSRGARVPVALAATGESRFARQVAISPAGPSGQGSPHGAETLAPTGPEKTFAIS
jgi:hypothetical protein